METAGLWDEAFLGEKHGWFFSVLELLKPRAKRLDEFASLGRFFFSDDLEYDETAVEKHLKVAGMAADLRAVDAAIARLDAFDPASLERALRAVAEARNMKAATLIHAVRVAVTGRTVSPGLFEVVSLLGRERAHQRLTYAIQNFRI